MPKPRPKPRRNPLKPARGKSRRIQSKARPSGSAAEGVRLQRVLASAGFGSRRACEVLIQDGRVEIDGEIVTELGTRVDPSTAKIRVDGSAIKVKRRRYFAVHKPAGFVTTHRDPAGRPRVIDLVPKGEELFPVGRLDRASEGLILVTNDGELANQLAHPKFGVEKLYRVLVAGFPTAEALEKLRHGVRLAEAWVKASRLKVIGKQRQATILEMALKEGKNREIRRMAAQIGHKVLKLRRIAFGPLRLGTLPVGAAREITSTELDALKDASRAARRRDKARDQKMELPQEKKPSETVRVRPPKSAPRGGHPKPGQKGRPPRKGAQTRRRSGPWEE
jgi:23S rRNA pseudouridine2605 synthase